jgi:hypothetical protein
MILVFTIAREWEYAPSIEVIKFDDEKSAQIYIDNYIEAYSHIELEKEPSGNTFVKGAKAISTHYGSGDWSYYLEKLILE